MTPKFTIILADDHALLREMLNENLEAEFGLGAVIAQVSNYDELLSLDSPACSAADIILLDYNMPGSSAESGVLAVLKKFPNSKVFVISGMADPLTARRLLDRGVAGFIPKTVPGRTLMNALRSVADGDRYVNAFTLAGVGEPGAGTGTSGAKVLFSEREQQILNCLVEGNSNKEIARRLGIQEMTIKTHLRNVYRKLGAQNRAEAVAKVLLSKGINS